MERELSVWSSVHSWHLESLVLNADLAILQTKTNAGQDRRGRHTSNRPDDVRRSWSPPSSRLRIAEPAMMSFSTMPGPAPPTSIPESDGSRPDPPRNLIQTGHLVLGPGARRDSSGILGAQLTKLTPEQQDAVTRAKKESVNCLVFA